VLLPELWHDGKAENKTDHLDDQALITIEVCELFC
jgi:hypothetical protein